MVTWQLVHPEEVVLLGAVSFSCHKNLISSILSGIQGDCKVVVEILTDGNQVTLREVENSDFIYSSGPRRAHTSYLGIVLWIHRIFKRQCRASGYKECARIDWGASGELET
jgi:hypothetical protein